MYDRLSTSLACRPSRPLSDTTTKPPISAPPLLAAIIEPPLSEYFQGGETAPLSDTAHHHPSSLAFALGPANTTANGLAGQHKGWKYSFNATAGFQCFWNLSLFRGAILFQWFEMIGGRTCPLFLFLRVLVPKSGGEGSSRCLSPGHSQAQTRRRIIPRIPGKHKRLGDRTSTPSAIHPATRPCPYRRGCRCIEDRSEGIVSVQEVRESDRGTRTPIRLAGLVVPSTL
ncbi:hypothetical protein QBC39DRAFT_156590 [Podospora conica]|nr:hypothetical protein QBC39DRAFT_156590 [Schizothecium conicum]